MKDIPGCSRRKIETPELSGSAATKSGQFLTKDRVIVKLPH
jgi:hypothetical protein